MESNKYGRKGIVKVKNKHFTKEQLDLIALVAPTATVIEIKDFDVVNKFDVTVPNHIDHMIKCVNPSCITNSEKIITRFDVVDKENLMLKCHYCEKFTTKDNIKFITE